MTNILSYLKEAFFSISGYTSRMFFGLGRLEAAALAQGQWAERNLSRKARPSPSLWNWTRTGRTNRSSNALPANNFKSAQSWTQHLTRYVLWDLFLSSSGDDWQQIPHDRCHQRHLSFTPLKNENASSSWVTGPGIPLGPYLDAVLCIGGLSV